MMKSSSMMLRISCFLMLLSMLSCVPVKVEKMMCNYEEEALAVDDEPLRFSWQLHSRKQACMQSAYQIEVYDSRNNRVWETDEVLSDKSQFVMYDGPALQPAQKYYWRLRVWNQKGKKSPWKESSFRVQPSEDWLDAQ